MSDRRRAGGAGPGGCGSPQSSCISQRPFLLDNGHSTAHSGKRNKTTNKWNPQNPPGRAERCPSCGTEATVCEAVRALALSGSAHGAGRGRAPVWLTLDGQYLVQPTECPQGHTHIRESPGRAGDPCPTAGGEPGPRWPGVDVNVHQAWGKGQTAWPGLGSARACECAVRTERVRVCVYGQIAHYLPADAQGCGLCAQGNLGVAPSGGSPATRGSVRSVQHSQ